MQHVCTIKASGQWGKPAGEDAPDTETSGVFSPAGLDLAILRSLQWPNGTVLRVGFIGRVATDLRALIVSHLNAWNRRGASISFVQSTADPQIRITLAKGQGYWSFVGRDCLYIPKDQPTMALEGLSTRTSPVELARVIRHEAGHALGFPHEHSRPEIVAKLDPAKVIAHFMRHQGWDEATIRDQILTPLPRSAFIGTRMPDASSVMCYSFPGSLTRDGKPISGGNNISALDARFSASIYPQRRA